MNYKKKNPNKDGTLKGRSSIDDEAIIAKNNGVVKGGGTVS
jgi:hypothetical protein